MPDEQEPRQEDKAPERASTAKKPHRMDPVVRAAFAGMLLERRVKLGLTQAEVAERSGYKETYIGKLERREHTPSLTAALMVSRALQQDLVDAINEIQNKMEGFKWLEGKDPEAADF